MNGGEGANLPGLHDAPGVAKRLSILRPWAE
jgi:hypothetical protein